MNSNLQILMTGVGSYLPKNKTSNIDLEKFMDTSDEWIKKRTGINFRHYVEDNEFTSDMGTNAAKSAIFEIIFVEVHDTISDLSNSSSAFQ